MATKQQEREALAKIQRIVDALGKGSCIGAAFTGCLELAKENIEFDFACNLQDRANAAEKEAAALEKKTEDLDSQLTEARKGLETARKLNEAYEGKINEISQELRDLSAKQQETETRAGNYQRKAEDAEGQIVLLKARLYDFMVAAQ